MLRGEEELEKLRCREEDVGRDAVVGLQVENRKPRDASGPRHGLGPWRTSGRQARAHISKRRKTRLQPPVDTQNYNFYYMYTNVHFEVNIPVTDCSIASAAVCARFRRPAHLRT